MKKPILGFVAVAVVVALRPLRKKFRDHVRLMASHCMQMAAQCRQMTVQLGARSEAPR